MINKELQISIRPKGSVGRQRKWEWFVYDYDGITPLDRGSVIGSKEEANSQANMAVTRIYMERQSNSD